jgi:voltage-gated potassium channel
VKSISPSLLSALLLIVLVFFIGVSGYYFFLPEVGLLDAWYMTAITLSTVGFGEVAPLSDGAKIFTIVFILISLTFFAFGIKQLTQYVLTENIFDKIKQKKMKKMTASLQNHTVICGFGRNGRQAAQRLQAHRQAFVVIEQNPELASWSPKIHFIVGDAREDLVLEQANVKKAKHLIAALPNDVDNLFVVLSARELNCDLLIVSRLTEASNRNKLERAGANHIIMPDKIGGDHMASLLMVPDLIRFLEELSWLEDAWPNLEEIAIDALPEVYLNRSLADLDIRRKTGCNVVGFRNGDGKLTINPGADMLLQPHSKLIVLSDTVAIKKLNVMFDL